MCLRKSLDMPHCGQVLHFRRKLVLSTKHFRKTTYYRIPKLFLLLRGHRLQSTWSSSDTSEKYDRSCNWLVSDWPTHAYLYPVPVPVPVVRGWNYDTRVTYTRLNTPDTLPSISTILQESITYKVQPSDRSPICESVVCSSSMEVHSDLP